ITTIGNTDSGPAPGGASRNDDGSTPPTSGMLMTTLSLARPRTRPLISWWARKLLICYSYLVPAALCLLATVVVPILLAPKMSLYADVLYKPQDYRLIGLGNYIRLVQDPVFW